MLLISSPIGICEADMTLSIEPAVRTQLALAALAVDLRKSYGPGPSAAHALAGVSVPFVRNRFTAVLGPPGSGKTTLLRCLAGLDRPTSGHTFVGSVDLATLDDAGLTQLRRRKIGLVFESHNLVPTLTVAENVTLPADLAGLPVDGEWREFLLEELGLAGIRARRPGELSRGEQQRVACARALISMPELILADEPAGSLDPSSAVAIMRFLRQCVSDFDQSVVMVTRDPRCAAYADHIAFLDGGIVVDDFGLLASVTW
jgi:putative ABC transport system ATP-binding protein